MTDKWADWLLNKRFGGNRENKKMFLESLYPIRDKIISNADVNQGETVLDIGCGDGLIGVALMEKVGKDGRVIFNDISKELLEVCKTYLEQEGLLSNAVFLESSVESLSGLEIETVDAITGRSVLIYVNEKYKAFEECFRVLKKGGRLSIFEPINRFASARHQKETFMGYDLSPLEDIAKKFLAGIRKNQDENDPMINFDERDLMLFLKKLKFERIQLEYTAYIGLGEKFKDWDFFYNFTPNPNSPSLSDALDEHLNPDEKVKFLNYLKPLVQNSPPEVYSAYCFLSAVK
jgi:ubiquinone/menaquinone biosynthesis C-methylase UbiE